MEKIWSGIKNNLVDEGIFTKVEIYLVGGNVFPYKSTRFVRESLIQKEGNEIIYDQIFLIKSNGEKECISYWSMFENDMPETYDYDTRCIKDHYWEDVRNALFSSNEKNLLKLASLHETWKLMNKSAFKFQNIGTSENKIHRIFEDADYDFEYGDEIVYTKCFSLIESKSINNCVFERFIGYDFEKIS